MKKVSIIGAGFSGLTLAWYLKKLNVDVTIYEKKNRPGGLIQTSYHSTMISESAANGLLWSQEVEELFNELKVPMLFPQKIAKNRYIWRNGLRRWPLQVFETLGFAFRLLPKLLFNRSSLRPRPEETIQEWGEKNLGPAATRWLVGPALQGVYAGDPRRMSASLILGRFFKGSRSKRKFRGTVAPEKGMSQLINALADHLVEKGISIHYESEPQAAKLPRPLVVATSARSAGEILKDLGCPSGLETTEMLSIMTAAAGFDSRTRTLQGFGVLFPRECNFKVLGVLSNSSIFSNRGSMYNETWILGGASNSNICQMSDEVLQSLIATERKAFLNDGSPPMNLYVTRWNEALPHYTVELEKTLTELNLPQDVYLSGNYLGGIGLAQILERNKELAQRIANG